jgi:hypothetical protein
MKHSPYHRAGWDDAWEEDGQQLDDFESDEVESSADEDDEEELLLANHHRESRGRHVTNAAARWQLGTAVAALGFWATSNGFELAERVLVHSKGVDDVALATFILCCSASKWAASRLLLLIGRQPPSRPPFLAALALAGALSSLEVLLGVAGALWCSTTMAMIILAQAPFWQLAAAVAMVRPRHLRTPGPGPAPACRRCAATPHTRAHPACRKSAPPAPCPP